MEYKYTKYNPERYKIEFNGTIFRDINEFVIDLNNIVSKLKNIYDRYSDKKSKDNKDDQYKQLLKIKDIIMARLDYITNTDKVDITITGVIRSKLIQFKTLLDSQNSNDLVINIKNALYYYYNRILNKNIIIAGDIHHNQMNDLN